MIIEVKKEDVYIPRWNGNRNANDGDQIKIHYRFPTPGEYSKYVYTTNIRFDTKGKPIGETEIIQDKEGLTRALVTKIDNFGLKSDGKVKKIETAADLYETEGVSQLLIVEVESAIMNASPEVDADFLSERLPST